ncbi:His Kinase A (phospho-acceptor) domain-containing protein [Chitinophaga jiangningensis]|uniref:histidine kinase n=1 Tax=Chitinophaga jiangningensis TaxID=1419482 RepID=A0A1M7HS51_9BACT|nr:sensor histidine kinase [Chitinophaga jiangningensis]SHM31314.1 His Kinase A (phospho-acceptor) domain-containing protein [Chitinophaga jiangningensis]
MKTHDSLPKIPGDTVSSNAVAVTNKDDMHFSVHKKIQIGFFIAFTVIVTASIFSYLVAKNLLDNAARLNHAIEVSKRLEVITKQVKEAEAAIRGFKLTKDSSFLDPTMKDRSLRIEKEYQMLRRVTADSKIQQLHLDTLRQLLTIKYEQLLGSNAEADMSREEKATVLAGESVMDRIDHTVQEMVHIEESQVHEKSELFNFFSGLWVPMIFISSLVAITIGIYSYITLTKEVRLQHHIESKLKSYQRDLQQNISLLNKTNQELEQFAYVASHDLQEPLRKISTFSDRLQVKYKEQLPADASELIDRMVAAVSRMRVLINDLLTFSRAGRIMPESIVPVDMNELLKEVVSDLEITLEEKNAVIDIDELPVIEGNPTAFHQLFQNLIANAIKFSHPERQLHINIHNELVSGEDLGFVKENHWEEKYCRISIADNGIGFDQTYADRIFLIFQRLHGISEYSGTGIGLAICKKIADSHHGFIMANGYPDKGATFTVILPMVQPLKSEEYADQHKA